MMSLIIASVLAILSVSATGISCNFGIVEQMPFMEGYCQSVSTMGSQYNGVLQCQYDAEKPYALFSFYDSDDVSCNGGIVNQMIVTEVACCEGCQIICEPYHVSMQHYQGVPGDCSGIDASESYNMYLMPMSDDTCYLMSTPYAIKYPIGSMKHLMKPDRFVEMIWNSNTECKNDPEYTIEHVNGCHYVPDFNITTFTAIESPPF